MDYGLVYGGDLAWPDKLIIDYTDADWGSDPNNRKSVTGNVYFLAGAAIGWLSKKQTVTATSTKLLPSSRRSLVLHVCTYCGRLVI